MKLEPDVLRYAYTLMSYELNQACGLHPALARNLLPPPQRLRELPALLLDADVTVDLAPPRTGPCLNPGPGA